MNISSTVPATRTFHPETPADADAVIAALQDHYSAAVTGLRAAITAFVQNGTPPPPGSMADGRFSYPALSIRFGGVERGDGDSHNLAFGRLERAGDYVTTVTQPALFADYLREQLRLLIRHYDVTIAVGASGQMIPFPYVLDASDGSEMGSVTPLDLARHFPTTELADIGDELADGLFGMDPDAPLPLALFDALRTDFSLARLRHYTGTAPEHFQRYILFTNYHRYVDEFVDWGGEQLGQNDYTALTGAGGLQLNKRTKNARDKLSDTAWRRHQMPAYHLVRPDGMG
ncbi:MAG: hypothetical protein RLZZ58_753, partial [Pseudomonadota bacterium]